MTKKEIVKTISEEIGLTQLKTKEIVQKTFDAIIDAIEKSETVAEADFEHAMTTLESASEPHGQTEIAAIDDGPLWVTEMSDGRFEVRHARKCLGVVF